MAFAAHVSFIVALRQLSIPIAALAGILLLKEQAYPPKVLGIALLFLGIVLLVLGS